jgi:hypothetical protein
MRRSLPVYLYQICPLPVKNNLRHVGYIKLDIICESSYNSNNYWR